MKKNEMLTKKATIKETSNNKVVDDCQSQSDTTQDTLHSKISGSEEVDVALCKESITILDKEYGGRKGPEPTRFGDWEKNGRCIDF